MMFSWPFVLMKILLIFICKCAILYIPPPPPPKNDHVYIQISALQQSGASVVAPVARYCSSLNANPTYGNTQHNPDECAPSREAVCTIFMMVFHMTRPGREPATYRMRGGHASH